MRSNHVPPRLVNGYLSETQDSPDTRATIKPKSSRTPSWTAACDPNTVHTIGITSVARGIGRFAQKKRPKVKMVVGQGSPNVFGAINQAAILFGALLIRQAALFTWNGVSQNTSRPFALDSGLLAGYFCRRGGIAVARMGAIYNLIFHSQRNPRMQLTMRSVRGDLPPAASATATGARA